MFIITCIQSSNLKKSQFRYKPCTSKYDPPTHRIQLMGKPNRENETRTQSMAKHQVYPQMREIEIM